MPQPDPLPSCPHLPVVDREWPACALAGLDALTTPADVFVVALRCAQSRWLARLPAQALLMLNRAFACSLPDTHPSSWPYPALSWILTHSPPDAFLGNPRRHFQHLATRMAAGPHHDLRVARAWACWAIACKTLPSCPADTLQLTRENLTEPSVAKISNLPAWMSRPHEIKLWLTTLETTSPVPPRSPLTEIF